MSIPVETAVAQSERTASRTVEGRAVVIVIDANKLHTLDAVGTFIWDLADGRSLGAIVDEVTEEFDVDRDQALDDARAFLAHLSSLGAIRLSEAAE